jgi:hypothetical protein
MTHEEQVHHKLHPFNIERNRVQGTLKVNQTAPVIGVGTNQIVGEGDFIVVDDESLLSLKVNSGILEVSTKLYDPAGQLIAQIENNEWISGDPLPWDLESDYQWLTIHHKRKAIALDIDARSIPMNLRAKLWSKGQSFQLDRYQIRYDGVVKNVSFVNLCLVGLQFSVNTSSKSFNWGPPPSLEAAVISWPDVNKRIAKGLEAWEKLKTQRMNL